MPYDPQRHHRRSIRLKGYDYAAPGYYFITICAQQRGMIFGTLHEGGVALNAAGVMICDWWRALPSRFAVVHLDAWIVMPDHVHGVITIPAVTADGGDDAGGDHVGGDHAGSPLRVSIGDVVGWFKTMTTNAYIRGVRDNGWPPFERRLWQRNYYEHIVRDHADLERIRQYIAQNPTKSRSRP
jgi:putative transposase